MATKKTAGPKGKYHEWITEDGLKRIESWAREGLTEKDLAEKKIGVSQRTLDNWKNRFPAIVSALKKGKAPIDMEVENALLKNALGYEYEETETLIYELPNGSTRKKIKKVKKHMKPDTTAQIFWLRNRKGRLWMNRDWVEVEKLIAETELTRERIKLVKGETKDTAILEALIETVTKEDEK